MRSRRRIAQPESLTSLLDTLFILIFAALVQLAAAQSRPATAAASPTPVPPPPTVAPDRAALRSAALDTLARDLAQRTTVIARISRTGVLTSLELDEKTIEVGVPLLEHVPDPDVALAYLGDRFPELRICRAIALRLVRHRLDDHLVIISPEAPLSSLTVALVAGLRRDAERCSGDHGAIAVVLDADGAGSPPEVAP